MCSTDIHKHVFNVDDLLPGVLASHPSSRDVHIHNFSVTFHGVELLTDTKLELNLGRRYGLVGLNGSGMSGIAWVPGGFI